MLNTYFCTPGSFSYGLCIYCADLLNSYYFSMIHVSFFAAPPVCYLLQSNLLLLKYSCIFYLYKFLFLKFYIVIISYFLFTYSIFSVIFYLCMRRPKDRRWILKVLYILQDAGYLQMIRQIPRADCGAPNLHRRKLRGIWPPAAASGSGRLNSGSLPAGKNGRGNM